MSIDFLPDERINIKDLVLSEPSKKAGEAFDVERDITPGDWNGMMSIIKKKTSSDTGLRDNNAIEFAAHVHLLMHDSPTAQELLPRSAIHEYPPGTFTKDIAYHKILYPEEQIDPRFMSDTNWHADITFITHPGHGRKFDDMAFYSTFHLFVGRPDKLQEMKSGGQGYVAENFERYIKEFNEAEEIDDRLIRAAAAFKLFFPEKADMIDLSDKKGKAMKDRLHDVHMGNLYVELAERAVLLKILAADKVEMTSEGIKFTMPKSENRPVDSNPTIPERRSF